MSAEASALSGQQANQSRFQPWLVCFCAALFFFFEFMNMNIFNAISPGLIKDFHLNATALGKLSASYYYGNVIFLLPAGIILDRVSNRRLILLSMLASIIGTLIFAMSSNFYVAATGRLIVGLVSAFCFLGNVRLASRWFPPNRLALVIGLIVTLAFVGGLVAQTPMTFLADNFGWRKALLVDAGMGLVILFLIFMFVRDYPRGYAQTYHKQHDKLQNMGFISSLKKSFANAQNWLGGFYTSFMNLPIILLGAVWGSLYLVQVHHFTHTQSSYVTSMLFFGTMLGSPFFGWLSDWMGRRKQPMLLCGLTSLATALAIIYLPNLSLGIMMLLFFLLGFFTSGQIISYPLIAESNSKALTGTSTGIASVIIQSGGFTQPLFGFLMGYHWNHSVSNEAFHYSPANYRTAMLLIPVAFGLALLAVFKMRETYCRSIED